MAITTQAQYRRKLESKGFDSRQIAVLAEVAQEMGLLTGTELTASMAELNVLDGATLSTAELNVLDGNTATAAELSSTDLGAKSTFSDDFLAAGIDSRISSTAGAGTGNAAAATVANGLNGEITLKSASDDGTHAQNCSTLTLDQLNYKANQGGLVMEARVKIDDVSEAVLFVGFTDTISTTVELPIFLNAADLDSDATDACGVVYDVDATTDQFCHGGVKAGTDTTPAFSGTAPVDATYFIVRVEVSAAGAVTGYINGTAIGAAVANAITETVAVTPAIVIGNRSANQVTATVDYFWAQGNR